MDWSRQPNITLRVPDGSQAALDNTMKSNVTTSNMSLKVTKGHNVYLCLASLCS